MQKFLQLHHFFIYPQKHVMLARCIHDVDMMYTFSPQMYTFRGKMYTLT